MTTISRLALCLIAVCGAAASAADVAAPQYRPVEAELVRPREGLGNVLAKLRSGGNVRIACLGGSITADPGWRFRFRGSLARVYDLLAPDGGQVLVTVDGRALPKPIAWFDSYCTYERIDTLPIADGPDPSAVHTVTVEVDREQPDRTPVAFRLQDPTTELKQPKYQGTNVRVGQILLLGEFVE